MSAADRWMAGRVQFFGYPEVDLGPEKDFGYDPLAEFRWPAIDGKRLDYRHIGGGDPKWIWELNRCQNLVLLIQAWLLTDENRYARFAIDEALRWRDQNPPGIGIAWVNGYEAGIRAASLAMVYDLLRGSSVISAAEAEQLRGMLWQHGRWIERDPSSHSSANNHRIGELVGLLAISLLSPEIPDAKTWSTWVPSALTSEAELQVLDDGFGAEQAFTYHLYVLDLLLLSVAMLRVRGHAVPASILDRLEAAGRCIWGQIWHV